MNFYLMNSSEENRLVIDSTPYPGASLEGTCSAPSWIEAKREFGLPLSAAQERILLARETAAREAAALIERAKQ